MSTFDGIREKVDEALRDYGVSFVVTFRGPTKRDDWECDEWHASFTAKPFNRPEVSRTFPYFMGTGHRKLSPLDAAALQKLNPRTSRTVEILKRATPQAPSAADVLQSLILDSSAEHQGFSDWCADLGYSDDSIKALRTWEACRQSAKDLRALFYPEQIRDLREMLQDY